MPLSTQMLPILQWAAELPGDASEFLDDLAHVPSVPPLTPAVDPLAKAIKVIASAYDRFPISALVGAHAAHATEHAAVEHLEGQLNAHKLGNGTLLQGLVKALPTILSILKLFGVNAPTA